MAGAIVLAGGKSERMGQDKAMIAFRGRTLLQHVVDAVGPLVDTVVVVAASADQYPVVGAAVLGDDFPGLGPVGGILTGLEALGLGAHLAVACDMPCLQSELLQLLLARASAGVDAVVPLFDGRMETLCAVYNFSAARKLAIFLEEGGRALHRALELMETSLVTEDVWRTVDPEGLSFTNLNTVTDFSALF